MTTLNVRTLRVGIIGYGYWGPNLTRNFFEIPASELTAIADMKDDRLQRAKNLYPDISTTNDYTDLFNMDLDAVIVSTPPATTRFACSRRKTDDAKEQACSRVDRFGKF